MQIDRRLIKYIIVNIFCSSFILIIYIVGKKYGFSLTLALPIALIIIFLQLIFSQGRSIPDIFSSLPYSSSEFMLVVYCFYSFLIAFIQLIVYRRKNRKE
jgi:hypothetical protein